MLQINQNGIAQVLVLVLLVGGLLSGLTLVGQTQIFEPQAANLSIDNPYPSPTANSCQISIFQDFCPTLQKCIWKVLQTCPSLTPFQSAPVNLTPGLDY
jgi:hypothetical protein